MMTSTLKRAVELLLVSLSGMLLSARGAASVGPEKEIAAATRPATNDRVAVILAPRHQAMLSAEVSGRVVAVKRELGQPFPAGEVLVELDDTVYGANARTAETKLASAKDNLARVQKLIDDRTRERHAEAVLAAAQANLVATQRLFENNHASQLDLENAKRDVVVAETNRELVTSTSREELTKARQELETATGERDIARDQLRACTIRGPWAGRVGRALIHEHELVQRGTPVIEVLDDRVLLAKFLLPSSVFKSARVGQELTLHVSEIPITATMRTSHIAAALDAASVTFEVYAEIDNAGETLRAGMNGWLRLSQIGER